MSSFLIIFSPLMIWIPLILIFGGYVAFSVLLFFFPTLLHKRFRYRTQCLQQAIDGTKILRIAHRGGPRYVTQNTIEAFKNAAQHSDMLQLDVCETKDGILVVHHDQELIRTCGVEGFIRDYNFQDLPPFKPEIELNFAAQGHIVRSNKEKMPTLEQVFQTFPQMPLNIELKTPSKGAINELHRLIHEYQRKNITIIGIRSQMQDVLREGNPNGYRWVNDKEFYNLLFFYVTGLLPYVFIEEVSVQLPLFTQEFYQWKIREWGNNWKTHAYFKILNLLNIVIQPLVSHLRKRGIMAYYWVCNTEKDIRNAINYGACGVMSDDPILLNQIINKLVQKDERMPVLQQEKKVQ